MKIFLLISFAFVAVAAHKCFPVEKFCKGAHQEYSECFANPDCQPTCDYPYEKPCPKMCVAGCKCKAGYVEDENRNCVKLKNCPKDILCRMGYKQHLREYTKCYGDLQCQPTCERPGYGCHKMCVEGCKCIDGYIEDNYGHCVKEEECPAVLACEKENKVYTPCDGYCGHTCENYYSGIISENCTEACIPGCSCAKDLLDDGSGNCVEYGNCPPEEICGLSPHKFWHGCGKPSECINTCSNPYADQICLTNGYQCEEPRCHCGIGFVEDYEGNCIRPEECPSRECGENEYFDECGYCEETCSSESHFCITACRAGCYCDRDYVRNAEGKCVLPKDCPADVVPAFCKLPLVSGPCFANMPSWGYDTETGSCTEFVYGGCQGNANRFTTEEDCKAVCL